MVARRNQSLGNLLNAAPWWISAMLAVFAFIFLRWIFPAVAAGNAIASGLAYGGKFLAPIFEIAFAIFVVVSAAFAEKCRDWSIPQAGLESEERG